MTARDDEEEIGGSGGGRRAPFGVSVPLAFALAVGPFLFLAPLALLLIPSVKLPPFGEQNQDAETLLFLLSFAVLLPAATILAPRAADRIERGPNRAALPALAAALCGSLIGVVLLARALDLLGLGFGGGALMALGAAWTGAALLALRAAASRRRSALARIEGGASRIWAITGIAAGVAALAFTDVGSIAVLPLVAGVAVGAAAIALWRRGARPAGRRGPWIDAAAIALILLAVPNLVIFHVGDPGAGIETRIIQFHQNFFLGPANHVLGGNAMLVDTLSQYGVGSIYLIAGWLGLVPRSNGMLGLLDGLLQGLVFASGYVILRLAGVGRLLSCTALAVAVIALVYGLHYPLGALLQHGAIRFGLPVVVVLAAVAGARWPARAVPARGLALLALGVSSIWALEAFAYCVLTAAGVAAAGAALRPPGRRRSYLLAWVLGAAVACGAAHLLLAGATLAGTGELPDWGWYGGTLRDFLFGSLGEITYDFSPWSPALLVGALYLASATGLILLLARGREIAAARPAAMVALGGTTAYGVALFSYFVNRSSDHILPYVSLPAVLVGALWLGILLRPPRPLAARTQMAGLGAATLVASLLVAVAWSTATERFSESALAHVPPGGSSVRAAISRLADPPDLFPGARAGAELLERAAPGADRSLVLTEADLSVEILARAGRANVLPLSDPWEDSFVPDAHLDRLRAAVAGLKPGELLLVDATAREAFARYRRRPGVDPLTEVGEPTLVPTGLAPLQREAVKEIGERFLLRPVAEGPGGLEIVELAPRPGA